MSDSRARSVSMPAGSSGGGGGASVGSHSAVAATPVHGINPPMRAVVITSSATEVKPHQSQSQPQPAANKELNLPTQSRAAEVPQVPHPLSQLHHLHHFQPAKMTLPRDPSRGEGEGEGGEGGEGEEVVHPMDDVTNEERGQHHHHHHGLDLESHESQHSKSAGHGDLLSVFRPQLPPPLLPTPKTLSPELHPQASAAQLPMPSLRPIESIMTTVSTLAPASATLSSSAAAAAAAAATPTATGPAASAPPSGLGVPPSTTPWLDSAGLGGHSPRGSAPRSFNSPLVGPDVFRQPSSQHSVLPPLTQQLDSMTTNQPHPLALSNLNLNLNLNQMMQLPSFMLHFNNTPMQALTIDRIGSKSQGGPTTSQPPSRRSSVSHLMPSEDEDEAGGPDLASASSSRRGSLGFGGPQQPSSGLAMSSHMLPRSALPLSGGSSGSGTASTSMLTTPTSSAPSSMPSSVPTSPMRLFSFFSPNSPHKTQQQQQPQQPQQPQPQQGLGQLQPQQLQFQHATAPTIVTTLTKSPRLTNLQLAGRNAEMLRKKAEAELKNITGASAAAGGAAIKEEDESMGVGATASGEERKMPPPPPPPHSKSAPSSHKKRSHRARDLSSSDEEEIARAKKKKKKRRPLSVATSGASAAVAATAGAAAAGDAAAGGGAAGAAAGEDLASKSVKQPPEPSLHKMATALERASRISRRKSVPPVHFGDEDDRPAGAAAAGAGSSDAGGGNGGSDSNESPQVSSSSSRRPPRELSPSPVRDKVCELCKKMHSGRYGGGRFCCAHCARHYSIVHRWEHKKQGN